MAFKAYGEAPTCIDCDAASVAWPACECSAGQPAGAPVLLGKIVCPAVTLHLSSLRSLSKCHHKACVDCTLHNILRPSVWTWLLLCLNSNGIPNAQDVLPQPQLDLWSSQTNNQRFTLCPYHHPCYIPGCDHARHSCKGHTTHALIDHSKQVSDSGCV